MGTGGKGISGTLPLTPRFGATLAGKRETTQLLLEPGREISVSERTTGPRASADSLRFFVTADLAQILSVSVSRLPLKPGRFTDQQVGNRLDVVSGA